MSVTLLSAYLYVLRLTSTRDSNKPQQIRRLGTHVNPLVEGQVFRKPFSGPRIDTSFQPLQLVVIHLWTDRHFQSLEFLCHPIYVDLVELLEHLRPVLDLLPDMVKSDIGSQEACVSLDAFLNHLELVFAS